MKDIDWSEAPEGATHAYQHGNENITWYKDIKENSYSFKHEEHDSWRHMADTGIPLSPVWHPLIPRPTQWQGPQDGLPAAGTEFEFSYNGRSWEERVMIFNDGITCLMAHRDYPANRWHYKCDDTDIHCRPIQSERDKATYTLAGELGDLCPAPEVVNKVIDLGYRKPLERAEAYDRAIKSVGATTANDKAVSLILDALGYKE